MKMRAEPDSLPKKRNSDLTEPLDEEGVSLLRRRSEWGVWGVRRSTRPAQ